MTVKLSHDRKVRSLAKKTLGSTRVGSAMRLPGVVVSAGFEIAAAAVPYPGRSGGEAGSTL